jgi:HSP20 family protein
MVLKKEAFMTKALTRTTGMMPSVFDDFMKPWNDWFDNGGLFGKMLTVPAVNVAETKDEFELSLAVPGMKKEDFKIDINGNLLTVSAAMEEKKEEKMDKMTREEYNYSSFSRTFTLPDDVKKEA